MRPSTMEVPQGSGVEVHEALVHHGGARGQVCAEAHAAGLGDAHAGGHHVVDHARELVHAVHGHGAALAQLTRVASKPSTAHGPKLVQHDVGQQARRCRPGSAVGLHQAVGEQVQAQPRIGGVGRGDVEVDLQGDHLCLVPRSASCRGRRCRAATLISVGRVAEPLSRGPRAGAGNQTSRTVLAVGGKKVARPWPEAGRVRRAVLRHLRSQSCIPCL